MDCLAKLAQKNGYSAELVSFLKKSFQEWNKTDAEKAIMQKKSEKSIIQIILRPWCEGVFDDPEKEMQSCINEGIEEYNAHCNPDGSFRYEDYD